MGKQNGGGVMMGSDKIDNAILCIKLIAHYDGQTVEAINLVSEILNLSNDQKNQIISRLANK